MSHFFYLDSDLLIYLLFVVISHVHCVLENLRPICGITKHRKIKMLYTVKIQHLNNPTQLLGYPENNYSQSYCLV